MTDFVGHLLDQAETLAGIGSGRPRQADLRRAVSTAYYAMFHFLIDQACHAALGAAYERKQLRRVFARAFEHAAMKEASAAFGGGTLPKWMRDTAPQLRTLPLNLQRIARTFVDLQEARHVADHDLAGSFSRPEARRLIAEVRNAVDRWPDVAGDDAARLYLAALPCWRSLRHR